MIERLLLALRMSRPEPGYEKVPLTSPSRTHICRTHQNSAATLRFFQFTTVLLLIATTVLAALYLEDRDNSAQIPSGRSDLLTCGSSVAEAQARGCRFDVLSKAWLPGACSRFGADEFLAAGADFASGDNGGRTGAGTGSEMNTWTYWTSPEGGREINLAELAAMGDRNIEGARWWTTRREHSVHCAWMLLRLAHAYSHGLRGDHMMRDYGHQRHCVMKLLNKSFYAPGQDEVATQGNVVFGSC